ncbi:MAG: DUF2726 domain-containing protein [Pseudomonadota bacterium]|nr:DUF2726 domain-containing protein [Pseudomonadota bacterium]
MYQSLPWIFASLSVVLLLAAGALAGHGRQRRARPPLPTEWSLRSRPVFSVHERRAYRLLCEALPHHVVLAKLPLVRICQPNDPEEVGYWYELLGSTHVNFAVCSTNGRVLAAIDLVTERSVSRRSMQIKQSVLSACRVRYLRCQPEHLPSMAELQLLVPHSGGASRGAQPAAVIHAARETLHAAVSRGRERRTLWQDSGSLHDSFFSVDDSRDEFSASSLFGSLRGEFRGEPAPPAESGVSRSPRIAGAPGAMAAPGVRPSLRH